MSRRAKVYTKYVVKRSLGGKQVQKKEDGSPVLGDVLKRNIVITPEVAETLNFGWDSTEVPLSFYYMPDEEANARAEKEEEEIASRKQSEREKLKAEVLAELKKDQAPKSDDKEKRKALFEEGKSLGLEFAKNIKTEALELLINDAKQ